MEEIKVSKVFILILMFVILVQMNSINIKAANKAEYDISPRYVVTCSAGGKHKMYVHGPYRECNNLVDDPIIHGFEWY